MSRLFFILMALALAACTAQTVPQAKTSQECPVFAQNMRDVESALDARR